MEEDRTAIKPSKILLGRRGEQIASEYLISLGHEIIARNWRNRHKEIDLITRQDDTIHFVEVKTRLQDQLLNEVLSLVQMRNITRAACSWLAMEECAFPFQFDLIGVHFRSEDSYSVHFQEEAFYINF